MNVVLSAEVRVEAPDIPASTPAEPGPRTEIIETTLDFSKRLPNTWKRKTAAFVYTYTLVSGRRHG